MRVIIVIHGFYYRSGANATGCRHQVAQGERYLDLRQNPVLGESRLLYCVRYGAVEEFSTVATIPGHFDMGTFFADSLPPFFSFYCSGGSGFDGSEMLWHPIVLDRKTCVCLDRFCTYNVPIFSQATTVFARSTIIITHKTYRETFPTVSPPHLFTN